MGQNAEIKIDMLWQACDLNYSKLYQNSVKAQRSLDGIREIVKYREFPLPNGWISNKLILRSSTKFSFFDEVEWKCGNFKDF